MDEDECMHVQVCVRAGVRVRVSVSVLRCEGGCVLAEMDTSAFNGAASQPPSNVDSPIKACRAKRAEHCGVCEVRMGARLLAHV